jgi:predicted Zn-dependent protease
MRRPVHAFIALALLVQCRTTTEPRSACVRFFEPYPDLVGGRMRTAQNGTMIDAMEYYRAGRFAEATRLLRQQVEADPEEYILRLYLANSLLATGEPFAAELQLDLLENLAHNDLSDQCEWYTTLCWLCSQQEQRAVEGARAIAAKQAHSYKVEATALLKELRP